jgi:hypothetical protein
MMKLIGFLKALQQNVPYDQDNRRQADYEDRVKNVFTHDGSRKISNPE